MRGFTKTALFLAFLFGLGELLIWMFDLSPAAFATPREILKTVPKFLDVTEYGDDVSATLSRTLVAFVISMPLGLTIGWSASALPFIGTQAKGLVDFLRSIPGTALVPVFFVIFGIGETGRISAAVYGGAFTVAIATIVGLATINKERRFVVEQLYGKANASFLRFELPEILPTVLVGMRTCISLCLVLIVVAEMFMGSDVGLGSLINDSRYSGNVPVLYTSIFFAGILGFSLNFVVAAIEALLAKKYPRFH